MMQYFRSAFGKLHPSQRNYSQWKQMSETERRLHRSEMADLYVATAERYEHDAIFPIGIWKAASLTTQLFSMEADERNGAPSASLRNGRSLRRYRRALRA